MGNPRLCALTDDQYARATGAGVSVAIIDSGVEASHPALSQTAVSGVVIQERFGRFSTLPYDGADVAGHGTACAGRVLRLAPQAQIVSCRILNRTVQATSQALLVALDWILTQRQISIVNLSLGTPNRQFGLDIAERVDALGARGVPVVVACGYGDRPDYPSAFGSPFSVAAVRTTEDEEIVHFAESVIEFGTRGYDVEVPWNQGAFLTVNGSSFSAPLVAGRLARFKSVDHDLSIWDLKSLLVAQARRIEPPQSQPANAGSCGHREAFDYFPASVPAETVDARSLSVDG